MERRNRSLDEVVEIEDVLEEYRMNATNYGKKFHKTRLPGSYMSSRERLGSAYLEEFSDENDGLSEY